MNGSIRGTILKELIIHRHQISNIEERGSVQSCFVNSNENDRAQREWSNEDEGSNFSVNQVALCAKEQLVDLTSCKTRRGVRGLRAGSVCGSAVRLRSVKRKLQRGGLCVMLMLVVVQS